MVISEFGRLMVKHWKPGIKTGLRDILAYLAVFLCSIVPEILQGTMVRGGISMGELGSALPNRLFEQGALGIFERPAG